MTTSTTTTETVATPTKTSRTVKHTVTTSKHVSTAAAPVVHKAVHTSRVPTTPPLARAPAETAPPAPAPVAAPQAPAEPAAQIAPAPRKAAPVQGNEDTALEVGGGILALLILGGGAYALSRRRRRVDEEEEWYSDEPASEDYAEPVAAEPSHEAEMHERVADTAPVAAAAESPSAFAWGNQSAADREVEASDGDDRRPGETWVERAYRGPSANNPSLSLRKRLKRASFFDMKERQATGGEPGTAETAREDGELVSA